MKSCNNGRINQRILKVKKKLFSYKLCPHTLKTASKKWIMQPNKLSDIIKHSTTTTAIFWQKETWLNTNFKY